MRKLLLLLFSFITVQTQAQLLVNLQLPVIGLSTKNQLWNMVLINTSNEVLRLKVNLIFTDATNNQMVMTASTTQFNLSTGSHALQINDFMPVTYNVVNSNYNIDNNPNGFLPVGQFNVCYQFDKFVSDIYERVTEECETVEIEPASPPILVFPEDQAVIEFPRPVFNWLPPSPVNFFSNLGYDLRLVEVVGNQSTADAMQQNIALFAQQNLTTLAIPYSASLPALDTGKLYAWQITAKNNGSFVAKSDIWSFRVGQFGSAGNNYPNSGPFAKLKRDGYINYFLCSGRLQVEYDNYTDDDTVAVAVYDLSNQQVAIALDSNYLVLKPGQNLIDINLTDNNAFSNNHIYQFELINSRKEKWIGKFYFKRE